ncbi:hypothetical protein Tco_1175851 [Tanacetum coccineum]
MRDDGEGDDDEVVVVMRMVAVTMVTAKGGAAGVVMGTKVVRVTLVVDDVVAQLADNATYYASAEDIAMQSCFFDIQLTSLSTRNCIPLDVLLRVSRQPAWSASKKQLAQNQKPSDTRVPC